MNLSFLLSVFIFGFAVWLGAYLINRDPRRPRLRYAGFGLVAYAFGLALETISGFADTPAQFELFSQLHWPLMFLPALCWFGAALDFLPDDFLLHSQLARTVDYGIPVAIIVLYMVSFGLEITPTIHWLLAIGIGILLLVALWIIMRAYQISHFKRPYSILLTIAVFFALSMGLFLIPMQILPREWVLLAVELDLILLGISIAILDTFDEGQRLRPDMLRSFTISVFAALIFGGLVGLALRFGADFRLVALLFATIFAAIVTQVFGDWIQGLVDRLIFARRPDLLRNRAVLRAAASASPRVLESPFPANMEVAEFDRLTRRALGYFGDFNRLAASPLTRLPLIDRRLAERNAPDNTLERAAELKLLLTESVARLKPRSQDKYGTTDEWRYYNVLYYPYILGLKPYSRDGQFGDLEPGAHEVLEWFRLYVPERTLYNWQNAAARLVAQDIREQLGSSGSIWQ